MLATEAEAKTKRCPESFGSCVGISDTGHMVALSSPYGHGQGGAYAVQTAPALCIASACMAWRWAGMRSNTDHARLHTSPLAMGHARAGKIDKETTAVGYCGKAGRP